MSKHSWQLAKFIAGPMKGEFCWVYLTLEQTREQKQIVTRSRPEFFDLSQYGPGLDRVVTVNFHCVKHYPLRPHGTRMDFLEMQAKGRNSLYLSEDEFLKDSKARDMGHKPWWHDVCLGEELERRMFGDEPTSNKILS